LKCPLLFDERPLRVFNQNLIVATGLSGLRSG
jgi:hypothetical protein